MFFLIISEIDFAVHRTVCSGPREPRLKRVVALTESSNIEARFSFISYAGRFDAGSPKSAEIERYGLDLFHYVATY